MKNNFIVEKGADYRLVDVCGDCDFAAVDVFRAALSSAGHAEAKHTIVDLTSCEFIDSTGVGVLVAQHRAKRNVIVVLPAGHRLQRIFELIGLRRYLSLVPTRESALALAHWRASLAAGNVSYIEQEIELAAGRNSGPQTETIFQNALITTDDERRLSKTYKLIRPFRPD